MTYKYYSDLELVDLIKLDDAIAFKELFDRYNQLLYVHAFRKLQNREESKDIVQEVFAMLWAKRQYFKLESNVPGYLYRSVQHKILDNFARLKINHRYIDSLQLFLKENKYSTDSLIRERQLSAIIDKEIAALPPKMRVVFELSRKSHLTHKEIAAELNISEETVKSQIKNALKLLRTRLGLLIFLVFLFKI